jgi:hypothetical protein
VTGPARSVTDATDQPNGALLDVEQLLRLWTDPLPQDDDAAAEAFRRLHADPVVVNGVPLAGRADPRHRDGGDWLGSLAAAGLVRPSVQPAP